MGLKMTGSFGAWKGAMTVGDYVAPPSVDLGPTDYAAYWNFDTANISGATLLDESGNGNTATFVSGPTTGEVGKVGEAFLFSGTEYCTMALTADVLPSPTYSVAAWVKSGTAAYQTIIESYDYTGGSAGGFLLGINNTGKVYNQTGEVGINYTVSLGTSTITDNAWHHVVVTFGSGNVKIYVDKVLESTTARADSISYHVGSSTTTMARTITSGGFQWPLSGLLDEIKLYHREISLAEVETIYDAATA